MQTIKLLNLEITIRIYLFFCAIGLSINHEIIETLSYGKEVLSIRISSLYIIGLLLNSYASFIIKLLFKYI